MHVMLPLAEQKSICCIVRAAIDYDKVNIKLLFYRPKSKVAI